jgi:hypothetical protein
MVAGSHGCASQGSGQRLQASRWGSNIDHFLGWRAEAKTPVYQGTLPFLQRSGGDGATNGLEVAVGEAILPGGWHAPAPVPTERGCSSGTGRTLIPRCQRERRTSAAIRQAAWCCQPPHEQSSQPRQSAEPLRRVTTAARPRETASGSSWRMVTMSVPARITPSSNASCAGSSAVISSPLSAAAWAS